MRPRHLLAATIWCLLGSGCNNFVTLGIRNLVEAPINCANEVIDYTRYCQTAEAAWKRQDPGHTFSTDYACGFKEGYAYYLDVGELAKLPAVPPWRYRQPCYETVAGFRAMEDWHAGFRHGLAAARASGLHQLVVLPSTGITLKETYLAIGNGVGPSAAQAPTPDAHSGSAPQPEQLPAPRPLPPAGAERPGTPGAEPGPLPSGEGPATPPLGAIESRKGAGAGKLATPSGPTASLSPQKVGPTASPTGTPLLQPSGAPRTEGPLPFGFLVPERAERTSERKVASDSEGTSSAGGTAACSATGSPRPSVPRPHLSLILTGPATAWVGDTVTFQVGLSNDGTAPATGVRVHNRLPPGLEYPQGGELEADFGTVSPGQTKTLPLAVMAVQSGRLVNEACVRADSGLEVTGHWTVTVSDKLLLSPRGLLPGSLGSAAESGQ